MFKLEKFVQRTMGRNKTTLRTLKYQSFGNQEKILVVLRGGKDKEFQ